MSEQQQFQKVRVKTITAGEGGRTSMIQKASQYTDASDTREAELAGADGVIPAPYPVGELQNLVEMSTILQQCVEAYRRNIVGFGAIPQYVKDDVAQGDETPAMKSEWDRVQDFIDFFSFEQSFEDVWGQAIEDREITGNGFIEILRDGTGEVVGGDRVDPCTMKVTKWTDYTDVETFAKGKIIKRKRRFRRYVQEVGASKVYFKEFGDPRIMDNTTGEFTQALLPEERQANEIIHLKIGPKAYGIPRWIGQLVHMYGARKAEELNYRYFIQGRHTPMAIMLSNAELSAESEQALLDYANSVEGTENAHKFLIIEAEGLDDGLLQDEKKQAKVELKSLAEMLQKDALFLEYDEASRKKVQSSFRLPDIYVGRTVDFNRATADTARSITEEQVFEPERNSIEWIINKRLLAEYQLLEAKVSFKKPEISDYETLSQMLTVINDIGGVAPNDVRELLGKLLGKNLEPFEGDEHNLPKGAVDAQISREGAQIANEQLKKNPPKPIQKADDDLYSVLKDIHDVIELQYSMLEGVKPDE